jgi:hypothetical protein
MKNFHRALVVFLLLLIPSAVIAANYKVGALEIDSPWARATAPTAPAGGGYLTIVNKGTTADRLVAVRSPVAQAAAIHEMKMEGNIMRMRELDKGLEIPAGGTVTLAPSGFHVMLMGLKGPLKQGTKVPLTLVFEKAGSIDVELSVESLGATQPGTGK